jgi:hypothetical protein
MVSKAHAAVVATGIRIAEGMGLHRDGESFDIPPFELHIRRLVWYQLAFLDIRIAESIGPRPIIRIGDADTKFPLNINEDDISPEGIPGHLENRAEWTDMTFNLMRFECNEMHRVVTVERTRLEQKKTSLTTLLGKIEAFRKAFEEKYYGFIDDSVPIQLCGRVVSTILMRRLHIMVLHRYHNSVSTRIPDRFRQTIIDSGCTMLEKAMQLSSDPKLALWAWYAGAYQQFHVAFLLLTEVFWNPHRKEADRIWRLVDYVFERDPEQPREIKGQEILTELRDKAGVFQTLRKTRLPIGLEKRVGQRPPRPVGMDAQAFGVPLSREPELMANMSSPETIPRGDYSTSNSSSTFSATSPLPMQATQRPNAGMAPQQSEQGYSDALNMQDDLMADIDWVSDRLQIGEWTLRPDSILSCR